ncbi:MAG TPA: hypothetical protein VK902_04555, partial [Rubrobacter sp.]|nr:hypothetical protein [Rubrobacter sp.]
MSGTHEPHPVILTVVEQSDELARIDRELQKRYGTDYRVVCERSGEVALELLRVLKAAGVQVAVVLADERVRGMSGTELLSRAHQLHPSAKRALLFPQTFMRWDEPIVETFFRAMALGRVDYFVPKPSRLPDESFHEPIGQFLAEWSRAQGPAFVALRIIGEWGERRSHELRDLCTRNSVPHEFSAASSAEGRELLARVGKSPERLPVVMLYDGQVLVDPSNEELADAFGA